MRVHKDTLIHRYGYEKGISLAKVDFGMGEREIRCTYRTLSFYEHEFCDDPRPNVTGDLIADTLKKITIGENLTNMKFDDEGNLIELTIDYTSDDWNVQKRALWAMLKTAEAIDVKHGRETEHIPSYKEWDASLIECEPDLRAVSEAVCGEIQRGLFRAGAAASGKTSEEEE